MHALVTLPKGARAELLAHLAAAPRDPARAHAARRMLLDAGALHCGVLVAEAHRRRALTALRAAGPIGSAAEALCRFVETMALLGRESAPGLRECARGANAPHEP